MPYTKEEIKERHRQQSAAWAKANPEKVRKKNRRWLKANAKKNGSYQKKWRVQNPQSYRDQRFKSRLKIEYGMTLEDFKLLLAGQGGKCAVCRKKLARNRHTHVDHDHKTGKVRGILCSGCNLGLGHFKENREALLAAAAYLST